ncbi:MAG TPA: FtsX-like permease family protein [Solirubrobacteraceae bacterium]|jgi:putative ABC transport system permease protein|nr:FtsX-like permease family protein [Solirubrobacteraceae bacterium]
MRPSALMYMYRRRLRAHGLQELLAGAGIAIAVALVFAALLSEASISGSAAKVVRTVVGPADLQLRARGPDGFGEATLARVKRLPGVRQAAPLLEATATLVTVAGRRAQVELAGADLRLATLDGLAETLPIGSLSGSGIGLSRTSAQALGLDDAAARRQLVSLRLRGRAQPVRVTSVLGPEAAGALSGAYLAVMRLSEMQRLMGLPGRVTRVLVQSDPGRSDQVRTELARLAGARLEVATTGQDVALLRQALGPSDLASGLFAAIGALLGLLLAVNAILLTVSERRRAIADLRLAGARRATVLELVVFEALCLGIPASLAGVLAGYLLSIGVFHPSTGYLAQAFTLSGATALTARAVALSLLGGVLVTCLASSIPLLDLRRGRARDAIFRESGAPGQALGARVQPRLALAALALVLASSALWVIAPSAAIPATALLALATVMCVPLVFAQTLRGAGAASEHLQRLSILPLALASLRATTMRSLALAATGAVALFGSVALGGARQNLLQGISTFARGYVADADIWVSNPGDNQAVESFPGAAASARIAKLAGVASVQSFQGGFAQLGGRRVWILARPPGAAGSVLAREVTDGTPRTAIARLAQGGWIAVSAQIAAERRLGVGDALTIASPTGPRTFRIAATTTNLAWPPGVIFMSSADYGRDWASTEASALGVRLRSGADARAVRAEIVRALGAGSGLEASLASERAARIEALAGEGLGQLREISTMLLIAAIVAMATALGSSIWQRRAGLAGLRLFGARPLSLQGILLLEAALILGAGCLTGAVAGVYGQVVIDAFLRHVTGFPLSSPTASARPLELFALVLGAALAVSLVPGWMAARTRPALALESE